MEHRLHHELVSAAGLAQPGRWLLCLHGVFGQGRNWRSFARKVTEARPDWGVVLVDLREHGQSRGLGPPHSLSAAAEDVAALCLSLGKAMAPISAICGHSMGGKVALCVREKSSEGRPTWVLDATPSAQPDWLDDARGAASPMRVLEALEGLPEKFATRAAFVTELNRLGIGAGVADWLATNLEAVGSEMRFALNLPALRALLEDAIRRDMWTDVMREAGGPLHFIIAGRSSVVPPADRERLAALAAKYSWIDEQIIAEAGHWLHVDALAEVVARVVAKLR